MPEGPLGAPRLTNIGPLSRSTEEEIRRQWRECPEEQKPKEICVETKRAAIAILEDQDFFAICDDLVDINSGNCYNIAERVFKNVKDVKVFAAGDGDHVWIFYDGVHYDAEAPTGVDDVFRLQFFHRVPPETIMHFQRQVPDLEDPEMRRDIIRDVTDEYRDG